MYVKNFSLIPSGSFMMGASEDDPDACREEKPRHLVTLTRDFLLQKTLVTQEQWEKIMGYNPSYRKSGMLPVVKISWFEVIFFCNSLSVVEGLPLAYELEGIKGLLASNFTIKKVRWDRESTGYRLPTEAEWEYCCRAGSPIPISDMLGNIWEWVYDAYGPYNKEEVTDPVNERGTNRVFRGGSWNSLAGNVRSSNRYFDGHGNRFGFLGFRLCRSIIKK